MFWWNQSTSSARKPASGMTKLRCDLVGTCLFRARRLGEKLGKDSRRVRYINLITWPARDIGYFPHGGKMLIIIIIIIWKLITWSALDISYSPHGGTRCFHDNGNDNDDNHNNLRLDHVTHMWHDLLSTWWALYVHYMCIFQVPNVAQRRLVHSSLSPSFLFFPAHVACKPLASRKLWKWGVRRLPIGHVTAGESIPTHSHVTSLAKAAALGKYNSKYSHFGSLKFKQLSTNWFEWVEEERGRATTMIFLLSSQRCTFVL